MTDLDQLWRNIDARPQKPDWLTLDPSFDWEQFVREHTITGPAVLQPIQWQPAFSFHGVALRVTDDNKLDVEISGGISLTEAAQLFIDEVRRILPRTAPSGS